jgi:hypothetical protein
VLLEEDWVVLRDMGAYVAEGGRRGGNLIREYDAGMRVRLRRPLRDRYRRMPKFEVGLAIPSIKATLSDREYALITSVAGANVAEPLRIPRAALWLEERVLQRGGADEEADEGPAGQVRRRLGCSPACQPHGSAMQPTEARPSLR